MLSPALSSYSTLSIVSSNVQDSIARYSRDPGACGEKAAASTCQPIVVRINSNSIPGRQAIQKFADDSHFGDDLLLRRLEKRRWVAAGPKRCEISRRGGAKATRPSPIRHCPAATAP